MNRFRVANIGQGGKATIFVDAHPRSTLFKVAAGEHVRMIRPKIGGSRRALKKFIAVCRDDERKFRMALIGQDDQAHSDRAFLTKRLKCAIHRWVG